MLQFKSRYLWQLLALLLVIALPLSVAPVRAQDGGDIDSDALQVINDAFTNLEMQETYQSRGESHLEQALTTSMGAGQSISMSQTVDSTIETQVQTNGPDQPDTIHSVTDQIYNIEFGGMQGMSQTITLEQVFEVLAINEQIYQRYREEPTMSGGLPGMGGDGMLSGTVPEGWHDPSEVTGSAITTSDLLQQYGSLFTGLSEENVVSVTELESETINDQEMRVFEIELSAEALREAIPVEAFSMLSQSMGQGMPGGGGDAQTEMESFIDNYLDALTVTTRVWIGTDDNLPHRIMSETVLEEGTTVDFSQNLTLESSVVSQTFDFINFGEEVDIPMLDIVQEDQAEDDNGMNDGQDNGNNNENGGG